MKGETATAVGRVRGCLRPHIRTLRPLITCPEKMDQAGSWIEHNFRGSRYSFTRRKRERGWVRWVCRFRRHALRTGGDIYLGKSQ